MTARPYAIVAYSPAASSELTTTERNCCIDDAPMAARARRNSVRNRCDRLARPVRLRPDEVELALWFVLRHDERERRFAGLTEFENAAGQDRVLQLDLRQGIANRFGFERSRVVDRGGKRPHRLIGARVVPLRSGAGGCLPLRIEGLHLRIRQQARPPSACEDVIGRRAESFASCFVGTTRA